MGVVWGLWVREVVVLERVLVFVGEGAGAGRLLASGERLLDQIAVAVDKKASPTEVCCQAKGAVQSVCVHGFGVRGRLAIVRTVLFRENRGDQVGDHVRVG